MPQCVIFDNTQNLWKYTFSIAAGASVSDVIDTQGMCLVGLLMPAAWTAAALQFQALMEATDTPRNVYDNAGNLQQCLVAANEWIAFPETNAIFAPFLRILSCTAGGTTPVVQVAAATITLVFRRYLS